MPTLKIDRPFDHAEKVRRADYLLRCKNPHCAGTVVDIDGERRCLLCLKLHDKNGNLVEPRKPEQPEREGRLYQIGRKNENR